MTLEIVENVEQNTVPISVTQGDNYDRYRKRIEREEAELAELERQAQGSPETKSEEDDTQDSVTAESEEQTPEPATVEETSFKKRYGDLRRHLQVKEREFNSRIQDLERQLQEGSKDTALPSTEAELQEWMTEYPDLARVVETIAIKKSKGVEEELNRFKADLEATKIEATREKTILQIRKVHTDFDDIVEDMKFHEWVKEQPQYIEDALYYNATDAKAAIRALDLYKADTGKAKKPSQNKNSERDASKTVARPGTAQIVDTPKTLFKESEIHAMNPREYAKHEAEIDKAIREGRVEWDISGAARV